MTVLVTGGAGYIGSHTVRLLRERGRDVVVLDSLERGYRDAVDKEVDVVVGDIADERIVSRTCRRYGVTEVIHFAAYKAVGESMQRPLMYWRNNVAGSISLVESLLANDVGRIVFSSSAAVYGTPSQTPVTEDEVLAPESVYADTKATIERFLASCSEIGLRSVSLRYFNAAGAHSSAEIGEDWSATQNLVPVVMKVLFGEQPRLSVFGNDYPTPDGTCVRDYIHVEDLAEAHVKALDYLAGGGESVACNVGTGHGTSVLQLIEMTESITGRPVPHDIVARRPGDPSTIYADPTRARTLLQWRATRDLREILSSAYEWHKGHPRGYSR
jgi:UDP-glucose-4-epimerase GalE